MNLDLSSLASGVASRAVDWLDTRLESQRINRLRSQMHYCGSDVTIYSPVVFTGPQALDIGSHTSIAPFVHIWCGGRVIIGESCMIGSHVAISSLTHDYTRQDMHQSMIARPVVIEDHVWVGSHAVILPGVRIGRGAVIGAGAVVTHDVEEYAIVVGVPARARGLRPGIADERHNGHPSVGPTELEPDGVALGRGWYTVEEADDTVFRWVASDAELIVANPTAARRTLRMDVEPGPGVSSRPFTLRILDDRDRALATAVVHSRQSVSIPLSLTPGCATVFRLRADGAGKRTPGDSRSLDFRVFALEWS
jgi:maltose O-acetyltransferase